MREGCGPRGDLKFENGPVGMEWMTVSSTKTSQIPRPVRRIMHQPAVPKTTAEHRPPASPGRTILFLLIALGSGLGLTAAMDSRRVPALAARLYTQTIRVTAPRQARVKSILVSPGKTVTAGEQIGWLIDEGISVELERQRRRVALLQRQLEQATAQAEVDLAWRTKLLDAEILNNQLRSADYLKKKYIRQIRDYAWQKYLHSDAVAGVGSIDDIFASLMPRQTLPGEERFRNLLRQEAMQSASEVYDTQIRLCDQRLDQLRQLKEDLPERLRRAKGVDVIETRLAAARTVLKQLESRQPLIPLRASGYGTVGVYRKQPGERVASGGTIVELLNQQRRYLVVQVPSRQMMHFSPGTQVTLRFAGGERRRGIVRSVPPQTLEESARPDASDRLGDVTVPVRVDPAGRLWPSVPIGSTVAVTLPK